MLIPEFETLKLGDGSETFNVETSQEVLQATIAIVSQTHRSLEIVSRHLEPEVYDNAEFAASLRSFVLRSRLARVRIIVMDSTPIIGRGHRVVDLAQRLTSYIEIRNPSRDYAKYNSAFLVADRVGSVHQVLADRFEGVVSFNDPRTAQSLGDQFEAMWPSATPDPNIRRLSL